MIERGPDRGGRYPASDGDRRTDEAAASAARSAPGQHALVLAALLIGILMMTIQLWLLTVALDLYLAGAGRRGWLLALVSGLIFLGGLLMLRLLGRRPCVDGRARTAPSSNSSLKRSPARPAS